MTIEAKSTNYTIASELPPMFDGPGLHPRPGVAFLGMPVFQAAAKVALTDEELRKNLRNATTSIRQKRARVVEEMPDWQDLRTAGAATKDHVLANLADLLEEFERNATAAGAAVHWARDAEEACAIGVELAKSHGVDEVVKVKSMATQEIGLNEALAEAGIAAWETDLAELIVQLGGDTPSHFLVPAIHRNREQVRQIFQARMGLTGVPAPEDLSNNPAELAAAARAHLRQKFLTSKVAFSGANFAIADTGTLVVVESEGNGRMCLTLPQVLISVVGIEKILPTMQDLEVFMQLLPRSSTAERMNPYTSTWTGVTPGDGPQEVHIILIDNNRSKVLQDDIGRQALRCIRCSACLNVCPVYEKVGGHAYGSVYPGPIGAILNPLMHGVGDPHDAALPFASSLCGACYEVCPMKINIPDVLIEQRARVVEKKNKGVLPTADELMMGAVGFAFNDHRRFGAVQKLATTFRGIVGQIRWLPGLPGGWTRYRSVPTPPAESFRSWWAKRDQTPDPIHEVSDEH